MAFDNKDNYQVENKVQIEGLYNGQRVTLSVDENGYLKALIQGTATVTGDVNSTDVNTVKQVQGYDGSQYKTLAVDSEGRLVALMHGKHNTNIIPVGVDSDGNLIAVIKGEYAGALKTILTDDKGYMLIKQLPILTFDRKGEVILYDDFSNGYNRWVLSGTGSGYGHRLEFSQFKSEGISHTLVSPLGPTDYVWIHTIFPYLSLSKYGYEYSFSFWSDTNYIDTICYLYDGTNKYIATIRYDFNNRILYFLDDTNNFQQIVSNLELPCIANLYNVFKLVLDWENKEYVRLLLNNNLYDLSGNSIYYVSDTSAAKNQFIIKVTSTSSGITEFTYDNFIVTINEPSN